MRVQVSCLYIRVACYLLYYIYISAVFYHVRKATMSDKMRLYIFLNTRLNSKLFNYL